MNSIQDLSEKLLTEFLGYCSKKDVKPVIIGGWAVFAFTQKEKSVDIDVLLQKEDDLSKIEAFFKEKEFNISTLINTATKGC